MPRCRHLLVIALLALLSRFDATAVAQGARGLPDPISSSALSDLLTASGLAETDLDVVAVPLDRYHAAFRDLRSGPIESWLEEKRESTGGLFGGSDAAATEDRIEQQQALANRIAALDDQLFADLRAAGVDESVAERAKAARSRSRSLTLAGGRYTRGLRFEPTAIYAEVREEVDRSPQWALDAAVREILLTHDRERTTRLASLARAAMALPIERAELLAAVDGGAPDPENATPEDFERWFAARRDAERSAAEDVREMQASLVAADRAALERVLAATGGDSEFAIAFRDAWLAAAHAGLFPDRESPASLFETAREMHADGTLDDETFEMVESVEASWRPRHRAIEDRLLRGLESAIKDGQRGGMSFGGMIEIDLAGDGGSERAPSDLDEARQDRADLDRDVRERLGEIAPTALASREKNTPTGTFSFGGGDGDGGQVTFSVAVVAGEAIGDGEPIALELGDIVGDIDFGDGGVFISTAVGGPAGAGSGGLARPIDAAAFDRIRDAIGIDDATRPIADALFADYRDGWAEIDATLVAEWNDVPKGGFGPQGPIPVTDDDLTRAASLRLAIFDAVLGLDAALFGDLAVVGDETAANREAVARRRAVAIDAATGGGFGMPGGDRTATVDLAAVASASLDPDAAARIASLLDDWSGEHTPALEDRARSIIDIDRDIALQQQAMERSFQEIEDGVLAPDQALFERMAALHQRRGSIDRTLAATNTEWMDRIVATLAAADEGIADAFRLAVDREAWPQCFRDPRSPEANFERAMRLEDLDDGTRMAIETLRGEWLASWTQACRRLVELDRDGPRLEPFSMDPGAFDPAAMQKAQADKRRVRFERNEIDEKAMRELKSLLSPDQQEIVGELPEEKKRMLLPGMGDVEMIIGG